MKRARLDRIEVLLLVASLLVAASFLWNVSNNPAGFFVDEASIAYNAHNIAQHGTDEYGHSFPLYFRAFGEYKSPVFIYLLSGLFRITGPSILVARLLSAIAGLTAALLLGLLGARVTRRRTVGFVVFILAGLTPWLFEISRLVFEVSLIPALLAAFLLVLHTAHKHKQWRWPTSAGLGALAGLMVYTYSAGRLLAPLFMFGLAFFISRQRWRSVVLTWAIFALTLLPLGVFTLRNPGALGERYKYVTYIKPEDTPAQIVLRFVRNYAQNFSLRSWLVRGDPEPRHHLPGMGSLLLGVVLLAAIGLVIVLLRHWRDAWWRFILYGLLVSPVPASLTLDHFHTLRLVALPVFLLVLTVPAIEFLLEEKGGRQTARHGILIGLVVLTVLQGALFQWRFHYAPPRVDAYDTYYPELLDVALARQERPIYILDKTPAAYVYAFWYATLRGLSVNNFHRIPRDEAPPRGAVVISHEMPCTNCEMIKERGLFKVYVQK